MKGRENKAKQKQKQKMKTKQNLSYYWSSVKKEAL